MKNDKWALYSLLAVTALFTAWSAIRPFDYRVWAFEIVAGWVEVAVMLATYRRFRFSNVSLVLVAIHFAVLATGAKYTYAEMPLFNWIKEAIGSSRNYFDRVGHFMQGFVPAILMREVLVRTTPLTRGKMLGFLCVCFALAASAMWEVLEWWTVVLFYPGEGQEWLGLQGDIWDTQADMLMALIGAALAVLLLSRLHDRSMTSLRIGAPEYNRGE